MEGDSILRLRNLGVAAIRGLPGLFAGDDAMADAMEDLRAKAGYTRSSREPPTDQLGLRSIEGDAQRLLAQIMESHPAGSTFADGTDPEAAWASEVVRRWQKYPGVEDILAAVGLTRQRLDEHLMPFSVVTEPEVEGHVEPGLAPSGLVRECVVWEVAVEGVSMARTRHAMVAGLGSLRALRGRLELRGVLGKLRRGLGYTRIRMPEDGQRGGFWDQPVHAAFQESKHLASLSLAPGMPVEEGNEIASAYMVDALLSDEAADVIASSGVGIEAVHRAVRHVAPLARRR